MLAPELLISFFAATALFAYMPGPAMLYASAQTIAGGRRAGLLAALGIHLGGYAHVLAAALGLSVIFSVTPFLFTALKLVGAAYLCWLGLRLLIGDRRADEDRPHAPALKARSAFRDSVLVEILNPKTAIFYFAFLPQFTDPSLGAPVWSQLLVLGTIVNVMFSSADFVCVLLADRVARWFRGSRGARRMAERVGGGLLIGLGLKLATQER